MKNEKINKEDLKLYRKSFVAWYRQIYLKMTDAEVINVNDDIEVNNYICQRIRTHQLNYLDVIYGVYKDWIADMSTQYDELNDLVNDKWRGVIYRLNEYYGVFQYNERYYVVEYKWNKDALRYDIEVVADFPFISDCHDFVNEKIEERSNE